MSDGLSRDFDISQLAWEDFFGKEIFVFLSGTTKILIKYYIYIYICLYSNRLNFLIELHFRQYNKLNRKEIDHY